MKCWIDGSSCPYQTGDNSFGLLNVSSNFCRDCNVLKFDLENIEKTLEKMGLLEFFPGLKHGIDEDDQYEISEHAGIILASLGLLKKEIDKKSKKTEISLEQIAILDNIPRLKILFKVLRKKDISIQ